MSAPQAIIIEHPVASFDTWKAAFDAHRATRKEAGFLAHHINRGADDTTKLTIFMPYSDRAKLDAFLSSADLKETMMNAGVQAPPTITYCAPQKDNVVWDRALPAILVRHRVADYDAWRVVYDNFESVRKESGIVGDAVNRSGEDGNTVIVYHQAETREALEALLASAELKAAMAEAGVLEAPQVEFLDGGVDAAQYN